VGGPELPFTREWAIVNEPPLGMARCTAEAVIFISGSCVEVLDPGERRVLDPKWEAVMVMLEIGRDVVIETAPAVRPALPSKLQLWITPDPHSPMDPSPLDSSPLPLPLLLLLLQLVASTATSAVSLQFKKLRPWISNPGTSKRRRADVTLPSPHSITLNPTPSPRSFKNRNAKSTGVSETR
jgi:hypothetical protein